MERLHASQGWGVLHLFHRIGAGARSDPGATADAVVKAVEALERDDHQVITFAVLGHKADLGFMAFGPDLARLHAFQAELRATALEPTDSFVSLTELSEYTPTADDERRRLEREGVTGAEAEAALEAYTTRMAKYGEDRLHPRLPAKRTICFYPMAKKRDVGANWFSLPFDERKKLMGGHAKTGRTYAGRVLQLITGATGLDDWEWGVTLVADDPVAIKEIVYEMRFDAASADYAVFGPFWFGLVGSPVDVLTSLQADVTDAPAESGASEAERCAVEAEARARLDEAGAAIADGVGRALPDWAARRVDDLLVAWGGDVDRAAVRDAARRAGEAAAARIVPELRALFALDADEQRATPLQLVRRAYEEPTAVLRAAGVPEVVRDGYAERGRPDDVYGLVIETFADVDAELVPWHLVWGAAKATIMRARHER